jgi:predicted acylesterase/phospholipase RssA
MPPIKHLVISGGGPIMVQILAAIQELEKNKYINVREIESIYGTSAGAIIGILLSLHFDWETLNDYIIKRPWHEVFPIHIQSILDSYTKKGLFDEKTIEKCFKPLFDAKDIPLNIHLLDFYKLTNIELHLFSFEVNEYKIVDISYLTHPELPVLQALHMSCALPILLTPVCLNNQCFIDGGIACNYPLSFCINSGKKIDEILGFKNKYSNENTNIDNKTTLLDYILTFLFKAIFSVNNNYAQPAIKNEVICDANYLNISIINSALKEIDIRRDLFEKGKKVAMDFLNKLQDNL